MKNFSWLVRVYYEDTDAGGVVYYANYLKFLERARTERLRAMGFEQDELMQEHGIIFAVKSIAVDYVKPARLNDELLISAKIESVKRVSLMFHQHAWRSDSNDEILCRAQVRIVCLDATSFRPQVIPDFIFKQITK